MKNLFKITFGKVFFTVFTVLVALIVFSSIYENELISKSIAPLFVPVFLIFFFLKNKRINFALILFFIFLFLGDISFMFIGGDMQMKISGMLYLLGFLCLIGVTIPRFKVLRLDKIIGVYLIGVFSINLYFLYTLYTVLDTMVPDSSQVMLFAVKSLALILLAFLAFGVYLSTQSKQSVLFLIGIIFMMFSSAMEYINLYYVYHWSFEMLGEILYVSSLYFIFRYIMSNNKIKKAAKINETFASSDNILA